MPLLVIDVAALGWNLVSQLPEFKPAQSLLPAVTCSIQASFRTGVLPQEHGVVANGRYFRDLRKVLFWEQSSALVEGPRIWDDARARGLKVGMMFWQQSMGEAVDLVVSPAPIHKHSGGMVQDCYTQPSNLQNRLNEAVGRPFNLMNYWGPLADHRSSDWIVEATAAVLGMRDIAPDLLFTYIPHLDYDLQRTGPGSEKANKALDRLRGYLSRLKMACAEHGYDWLIFGDYAIEPVTGGAIFPNLRLREAGLFRHREIGGMAYTDFHESRAFAVVDHQIAHVHCRDAASIEAAKAALSDLPGVSKVLDREAQKSRGIGHANSGELVLVAERGSWFAYPWFTERSEAPDYASHVDIHNKPGYDPCELFFGWPPPSVSFDTRRIRGAHGCVGMGLEIGWATSLDTSRTEIGSVLDLSHLVRDWLNGQTPR